MQIRTVSCRLAALLLTTLALPASAQVSEGALPDKIFRQRFEGRPVSGSFVVNGYPMPFPQGSYANGAQQASPAVYVGRFWFPPSTLQSNVNGLGMVTLNTQLVHSGTTSNALTNPNLASIQMTEVYLRLTSATVSGFPVSLGNDCTFGPIQFIAQGSWTAASEVMSGNNIVIPPVPATACGGYSNTLNNSIAGSNNSVNITVAL